MTEAKVTCGSCRWFQGSDAMGRCKANPPQVSEATGVSGVWPYVNSQEWCGKWTPIKGAKKQAEDVRGADLVKE